MPDRTTSPEINQITVRPLTQHEFRSQYVKNWENNFMLLNDKLLDKNGNSLKGAALISRKAKILRQLEFGNDIEKLPTFKEIIEKRNISVQTELEQELENIQPGEPDGAETTLHSFREFLKTSKLLNSIRQAAAIAVIVTCSYLGARLFLEKLKTEGQKIETVVDSKPSENPLVVDSHGLHEQNPGEIKRELDNQVPEQTKTVAIATGFVNSEEVGGEVQRPVGGKNLMKHEEDEGIMEAPLLKKSETQKPPENKIMIDSKVAFPVGIDYPLSKDFIPPLVKLADYQNIEVYQPKANTDEGKGQPDAAIALSSLFIDAKNAGVKDMYITSGYRNWSTQNYLYNKAVKNYGSNQTGSAAPEHSEHRTGLAFDLTTESIGYAVDSQAGFENTPAYKWLAENAYKYGFIMTYTKAGVDGRIYEPWHWRYVGIEAAKIFWEKNYLADTSFNTINTLASLNSTPQLLAMK